MDMRDLLAAYVLSTSDKVRKRYKRIDKARALVNFPTGSDDEDERLAKKRQKTRSDDEQLAEK